MKKFLFLIFITAMFGCTKEQNSSKNFTEDLMATQRSQLPDPIQLLDLLSLPADGYVYLSNWTSLSSQSFRGPDILMGGYGYDKAGTKQDFGNLSFNTLNLVSNATSDYFSIGMTGSKDLFGTTIPISLAGKNSLPGFSSSFYAPKLMTITSPAFSNNSMIAPGTTITWEPDTQNTLGVGIVVEYDPDGVENLGKGFSGSRERNPVHTEDDGSYTFTSDDLKSIPSTAKLGVSVGRGNYARVTMNNDYHFGIISYSVVKHYFTR